MRLPKSRGGPGAFFKSCVFITLCALWLNPLLAQVDFFGYFESELDQIQFTDKQYSFGYNKLRLDFESRPNDQILFVGNINVQKFFGKTTWNFLDFIPKPAWEGLFPEDQLQITINDTLYLENLFLRVSFQKFDLTLGRQPIAQGTGYAWNPLDIFNRKDLIDPTYELPGVDAIRVEIPLGERMGLDVIVAPDSSWKMSTKMMQLKLGLGSFDFTMNWAQQFHLFPYWKIMDIMITHDIIEFIGGSFVGQIGEIGLWGEGLWSMDAVKDFGEFVVGADHTFDNGLYIMAEYFHNTLGAEIEELAFRHYQYYFTGETLGPMQNYLFFVTQYALTDFISGGLFGFGNLDDQSFSIIPLVEWSAFENVTFSLWVSQAIGEKNTEFGVQDIAVRLRLRAYF